MDLQQFCDLLEFNSDYTHLEELVQNFEATLTSALDICASETTCTRTIRSQNDWFNENLQEQKRIVRNRDRVFGKYRENHQWTALKKERNKYNYMLKQTKKQTRSDKIMMCQGILKSYMRLSIV